jgi:DNA repair protein RadB
MAEGGRLKGLRSRDNAFRIPLNCCLDALLGGGVETKVITQFYGPPGSGKTNFCMQASVSTVGQGLKVVYVDTEAGHSFERLRQIAGRAYEKVLKNSIIFEPRSFEDQGFILENLGSIVDDDFGLVVLDSAVSLYRLVRDNETASRVNRELSAQMAILSALAKSHNMAVVITNQVYSPGEGGIEPVGGSILKYWSKAIVELVRRDGKREAVLKRHRSLKEGTRVTFVIADEGIRDGR